MPAGSVYAAPVGTKLGDAGWKLIGTTVDGVTTTEPFTLSSDRAQLLTLQDRVNRALIGSDWAANGWKPAGFADKTPAWLRSDLQPHFNAINEMAISMANAQLGGFRQRFMTGSLPVTLNERSKPMGLTKEYEYTDRDGDMISVHKNDDESHPVIGVRDEFYAYIQPEYSIPLAINVLGYDRPSAEPYASTATEHNGQFANTPIPTSKEARDANIAKAVDLLIGADIADQRIAANKAADEVKAAKEAKAKRDAELNAELAATTRKLRNLSETVADFGVTAIRAEEIAEAAAKYKAAFEAHAGA